MEPPAPADNQTPALQDSSGESLDESSDPEAPSLDDGRRNSNKHASSSGKDDAAPASASSTGKGSSTRDSESAAQQSTSGNGASKGVEVEDSSSGQQQEGDGNGSMGLSDGVRPDKVKEAVSIAGNKMQQAMQEEGTDTASRSELHLSVNCSHAFLRQSSCVLAFACALWWEGDGHVYATINLRNAYTLQLTCCGLGA